MADTELNISPDEKVDGVPLARLLRNLDETSYNEGSVDLACRLTDCKAVIEELLQQRALASRPAEVDDWISVDDQMPPKYRCAYLVYTPDSKCVFTGHISINDDGDEHWYHFASGRYIAERVSHWMELPTPPSHTTNKEK